MRRVRALIEIYGLFYEVFELIKIEWLSLKDLNCEIIDSEIVDIEVDIVWLIEFLGQNREVLETRKVVQDIIRQVRLTVLGRGGGNFRHQIPTILEEDDDFICISTPEENTVGESIAVGMRGDGSCLDGRRKNESKGSDGVLQIEVVTPVSNSNFFVERLELKECLYRLGGKWSYLCDDLLIEGALKQQVINLNDCKIEASELAELKAGILCEISKNYDAKDSDTYKLNIPDYSIFDFKTKMGLWSFDKLTKLANRLIFSNLQMRLSPLDTYMPAIPKIFALLLSQEPPKDQERATLVNS